MITPDEYQMGAIRTEAPAIDAYERLTREGGGVLPVSKCVLLMKLIHGSFGLCTEGGEFQDQLKKHIFYGKPLDLQNLKEELGDVLWYVAILCSALDIQMSEVMSANLAKLKVRYPEKFDSVEAVNRDIKAELAALDNETA